MIPEDTTHDQGAYVFTRCARALYGPQFVAALASRLGVPNNTVGKWASGKSRVPPGVWKEIASELEGREAALPQLHEEAARRAAVGHAAPPDAALPEDQYFVFLGLHTPSAVHNLRFTRSIVSAGITTASFDAASAEGYARGTLNYLPFIPNPNRHQGAVSSFAMEATRNYEVEYDAEYIRANEFPLLPSRLSCVYAFRSMADCHAATLKYGWELASVRRFRLVPTPLNRVHRVNMEVVSLMRYAMRMGVFDRQQRDQIWRHYWHGGGSFSVRIPDLDFSRQQRESGEIWECLIEGRLDLLDPL